MTQPLAPAPSQNPADSTAENAAEITADPLLARLRANEAGAYEELVATIGPRLLAVARTMLADEQEAQDAVQDAFLNAFRTLADFDGRSLVSTWLHRITVNCCLMKLRTRRRKPMASIDELLPRFSSDGHQERPNESWKPIPGAGIERTELLEKVRCHIESLPEQFREIILLRDVLGLSTEEAAQVLSTSTAAAKTRLSRARQALRALVEPNFAGMGPMQGKDATP